MLMSLCSFLKKEILPWLEGQKELSKGRIEREVTVLNVSRGETTKKTKGKQPQATNEEAGERGATTKELVWVWKVLDKSQEAQQARSEPDPRPFGWEVGVGEDLSHLNKRRQIERKREIRRDLHTMKVQAGIERFRERSQAGVELRAKQVAERERRQLAEERRKVREAELAEERMRKPMQSMASNPEETTPATTALQAAARLFAKRRTADMQAAERRATRY